MRKCLFCYMAIEDESHDYHPSCSKKIFGQAFPPILEYSKAQIEELGMEIVKSQMAVTGVQPKLSLHLTSIDGKKAPKRFTIVGLWGGYILKTPSKHYLQLPEVEDLTMHLAEISKIKVVPHSLIRLQDNSMAYITKRIDRTKNSKLHMEDMCQLTERLTEDKYHGSYEQIAKIILKHSSNPGLDVVNFYEQVLFSFLTANADMHLKNFSLIKQTETGYVLAPAYDLVATTLIHPADDEEMALTLNGKKKKINRLDFIAAFNTSKLDTAQQENIFRKMNRYKSAWFDFIDLSFLHEDLKVAFKALIDDRFSRINT